MTPALIRNAAYWLIDQGYSVLPVYHGKAPGVSWKEFQRRQSTLQEFEGWMGKKTPAGLGVVCGAISNLIVLDIDDIAMIETVKPHLPDGLLSKCMWYPTSRGYHIWFRHEGSSSVRGTTHVPGVDILSDGAFCVCPPRSSALEFNGPPVLANELPTLPGSLMGRLLREPDSDIVRGDISFKNQKALAMHYWRSDRRAIPEGNRNNQLFRASCYFLARTDDPYRVMSELVDRATRIDGLGKEEAVAVCDNAMIRTQGKVNVSEPGR